MDLLKAICIALKDARYPSDRFSFKLPTQVFNDLKYEFKDLKYSLTGLDKIKTLEFKMQGYIITVTPED